MSKDKVFKYIKKNTGPTRSIYGHDFPAMPFSGMMTIRNGLRLWQIFHLRRLIQNVTGKSM